MQSYNSFKYFLYETQASQQPDWSRKSDSMKLDACNYII